MPNATEYAARTYAAGLGVRARAGRCADCGEACGVAFIWCPAHRRTGPRPGMPGETWEEFEASHGRKVLQYDARGQV